ncbi:superoxide dismutase [Luteolibacter algae]|uniref:Superoxide dismutase n=1 Tax=Luteolibacter algae TaxID=454151 RepID=A0ABW5D619_9BACT
MFERRSFLKVGALAAGGLLVSNASGNAAEEGAGFKLPDLGYGFDALEPHIDRETMEIHHGKHHAGYVAKLNAAVEGDAGLKGKSLEELVGNLKGIDDEAVMTAVRNNGGGHWNHSFFWKSLTPAAKSGKPSEALAKAINADFGSLEKMKEAFEAAAGTRFGSGWAWLIQKDGKLKITSTPNQDNPLMKGVVPDEETGTPLLGLDVWEHAYYLKYQNKRADYAKAFWSVIDWEAVSGRLV